MKTFSAARIAAVCFFVSTILTATAALDRKLVSATCETLMDEHKKEVQKCLGIFAFHEMAGRLAPAVAEAIHRQSNLGSNFKEITTTLGLEQMLAEAQEAATAMRRVAQNFEGRVDSVICRLLKKLDCFKKQASAASNAPPPRSGPY